MVGELPKLLGRDFAVGFLVPVVVLLVAGYLLLRAFDAAPEFAEIPKELSDVVVGVLVAWTAALGLAGLNMTITRFFMGLGVLNPFRIMRWRWARRFNALLDRKETIISQVNFHNHQGWPVPPHLEFDYGSLKEELARHFPSSEDQVLPTRLGNAIAAFQDYPRVIYGFDSIEGWDRVFTVIPKEHRELVEHERSLVNFWVNLWLGALLLLLAYVSLAAPAILSGGVWPPHWWIPAACLLVAWLASRGAAAAALVWGSSVKAAFDIHLGVLTRKLGYEVPGDAADQYRLWTALSQTFLHRDPGAYEDAQQFRAPPPKPGQDADGAAERG